MLKFTFLLARNITKGSVKDIDASERWAAEATNVVVVIIRQAAVFHLNLKAAGRTRFGYQLSS